MPGIADRLPPAVKDNRGISIGLAVLLVALIGVGIWQLTGSSDSGGGGSRSLDSVLAEHGRASADAESDAPAGTDAEGEEFFPSETDAAAEGAATTPAPRGSEFESYTSSRGGWTADLPSGGGWGAPAESEVGPGLFRVTVSGPGGQTLVIDSTPAEVPTFNAATISREPAEHPVFTGVEEVVFRGSTQISACNSGECVDYLVPNGDGGFAVLAGGADLETSRATAKQVVESLRASG